MAIHHAMEDVHVTVHKAGFLGRHDQVRSTELHASTRCNIEGDDAVEAFFAPDSDCWLGGRRRTRRPGTQCRP